MDQLMPLVSFELLSADESALLGDLPGLKAVVLRPHLLDLVAVAASHLSKGSVVDHLRAPAPAMVAIVTTRKVEGLFGTRGASRPYCSSCYRVRCGHSSRRR